MDEDLCPEILKRLPIKSLCRFRCVCKPWKSIISSDFFINLHFTFTFSTTPSNLKPNLHVAYGDCVFYPHSHPLSNASHESYTLRHTLDDDVDQQLYFPFRAMVEDAAVLQKFTFVDVIHGVVCIYYWPRSIFLWNPSIHKYVSLPSLSLTRAIGFGYDASKNDFKVVAIDFKSIQMMSSFKVYSTRQGLWRQPTTTEIINLDPSWALAFINNVNGCFVKGTIHWLLERMSDYFVLMFDCESEEVRVIDIPKKVANGLNHELVLFEYAGMLAALVRMRSWVRMRAWVRMRVSSDMNLWVMKEHGVSSSWKKLPPYGPTNLSSSMLCYHLYNKSMFLMDHPKAQSYANHDIMLLS